MNAGADEVVHAGHHFVLVAAVGLNLAEPSEPWGRTFLPNESLICQGIDRAALICRSDN